jgi:hypothetical protein
VTIPNPNPSISSAFGKFPRKRSLQVALSSSDTSVHPSKKSYQQQSKTGGEESSHDQSHNIEFGTEESTKALKSLAIRPRALVINSGGVCGVAIPTAALASFHVFSVPLRFHNGSPFAQSKKSYEAGDVSHAYGVCDDPVDN